jgi:hypothetical protein
MKATTVTRYNYYAPRRKGARYPGCTTHRFCAEKLVDTLLAAAITLGAVVILLALLIL